MLLSKEQLNRLDVVNLEPSQIDGVCAILRKWAAGTDSTPLLQT